METQGQPQMNSKFGASLGYMKLLKIPNKKFKVPSISGETVSFTKSQGARRVTGRDTSLEYILKLGNLNYKIIYF